MSCEAIRRADATYASNLDSDASCSVRSWWAYGTDSVMSGSHTFPPDDAVSFGAPSSVTMPDGGQMNSTIGHRLQ
jgi:hypothetical protein